MSKSLTLRAGAVGFLLLSSIIFLHQYNHLFQFTREALGKYFHAKWLLYAHIVPGGAALLIGPTQLLREFRNRNMKLHRILGKIYLLCILVAASGALSLTFITTNVVGYMYTISIWFMLFVWVCSTSLAYWTIRRKKIIEHEEWMMRSYLTTFAFIIQNYILKIPGLLSLGSFAEVSPNIFWFSWALPLFGYQVYLTISKSMVTRNLAQ